MTPQQANELLRGIGSEMSNVLYNLGQHKHRVITERESTLFYALAKKWDEARRAPTPTSEPGASIRDHEEFREDLLRLSTTQHRQTLKAIRKDIYDTIDRRVANAVAAALATPASPTTVCAPNCFYGDCPPCVAAGIATASPAEHVAEVGSTYQLVWAGSGPIASIVEKHGLKVGSKLYAHPAADPAPLVAQASPWISVDDRLPPIDKLVMVYSPPTTMSHPNDVDISFDCIDPNDDDAASWLGHNEHYEHWCCVAKPEGSTGPREKAPYTHWMPIPPPPEASPLVEDAQRIVVGKISQDFEAQPQEPAQHVQSPATAPGGQR